MSLTVLQQLQSRILPSVAASQTITDQAATLVASPEAQVVSVLSQIQRSPRQEDVLTRAVEESPLAKLMRSHASVPTEVSVVETVGVSPQAVDAPQSVLAQLALRQ